MKPTKRVKKAVKWNGWRLIHQGHFYDTITIWPNRPTAEQHKNLINSGYQIIPVHITPLTPPRKE